MGVMLVGVPSLCVSSIYKCPVFISVQYLCVSIYHFVGVYLSRDLCVSIYHVCLSTISVQLCVTIYEWLVIKEVGGESLFTSGRAVYPKTTSSYS